MKHAIPLALLAMATPAAAARDSLGIFESWGAFRDDKPLRCYAISEPQNRPRAPRWRAFASISFWPGQNIRGQLHVRLSREHAPDAPVTLQIGTARFALVAGGADSWASDPRSDAAIVAALRISQQLRVESRDSAGNRFADTYRLRGAATAIDAAALGCARRG